MHVKNTAKYLEACLDSILSQTEQNWELIAVENNSKDGCLQILEDYKNKDSRIKVCRNKNGDLISALRLASTKVQGELITRMDSDDIMPIDRIEIRKGMLLKSGIGNVATGLVKYFSDDKEILGYKRYEDWLNGLMMNQSNYTQIYKECVIPSPCWMLYTSDFNKAGGFNRDVYPEDYDLCFRLYEQGINVLASKSVLLHWRDYDSRNSRTDLNYADPTFFPLKLEYFLRLDLNTDKKLVLWGLGDKGKTVSKMLIEASIDFQWVTTNPNKIGKNIYDKIIYHPDEIQDNSQVITVVGNEDDKQRISNSLSLRGIDHFNFC